MQITCRNFMRTSVYQTDIIKFLECHHLVSLADVAAALEADFSTLYRNMQSLEKEGVVRRVVVDSKRTLYELASHQHDHFLCTECDTVEAIDQTRIKVSGHQVEDVLVRGKCTDCTS